MLKGQRGQIEIASMLLPILLVVLVIGGAFAVKNLDLFADKGEEKCEISPTTGKCDFCENIPTLEKSRQDNYVYAIGAIDINGFVGTPTITVSRTKLTADQLGIALLSRDVRINGKLFLVDTQGITDVGYEGTLYRSSLIGATKGEYLLEFPGVPSNWNCEDFATAGDKYRPQGARYAMVLKYIDIGKTPAQQIDTYQETIYVKYVR